jgi:hypothetical protein
MTERHITHIEDVRRDYSEVEIREKGQAIAKFLQDQSRREAEKKLAADAFKGQIETVENTISELGKQIRLGYETVPTPCDVVLNRPTPGMKSFISQKTLEVVKTAPMTDTERQRSFFEDFKEGEEPRPFKEDEPTN